MPIEVKDILAYLGMDATKVDSIDKFQETFNPAFVKKDPIAIIEDRELYGKVLGKKTGAITTAAKRALKRNGIELTDAEIKDLHIEDLVETVIDKTYKTAGAKVADLEAQLSRGTDEATKALKADVDKWKNDFDTLTQANNGLKTEFETFKTSSVTAAKTRKLNEKYKNLFEDQFQWSTAVKDDKLKKEGTKALFNQKFKLDIANFGEDNEEIIITDLKGNRIPDPKVNSTFKKPEDVVKDFGIENQVWAVNPHQQQKATPVKKQDNNQQQNQDTVDPRRKVNTMIPARA